MRFSFWKDIRPSGVSNCWDVSTSVRQAPVVLFPWYVFCCTHTLITKHFAKYIFIICICSHGMQGNQHFKYKQDTKQLFHPVSHQCLDMDKTQSRVYMEPCDDKKESQQWTWQNTNWTVINGWKEEGM
jgi:polypeptide N-acetylgalactosaminyltransferase